MSCTWASYSEPNGYSPRMNRNRSTLPGPALATLALLASCAGTPRSVAPPGGYLGQTLPGSSPELFAPGIVSTPDAVELNGVFSPDFTEFFFARRTEQPGGAGRVSRMFRCVLRPGGAWSTPEPLKVWPDGAGSLAVDMACSPDGKRLYFLGKHPHAFAPEEPSLDIFVCDRTEEGGWSLAKPVPPPVWTGHTESYPAFTPEGALQFSSDRPGGQGKTDLWRAAPHAGGGFELPENMGPVVNSPYSEGDSCVAPDGSYIVFTSNRPGGPGNGDLYVSFRGRAAGEWSEPVLLGNDVNTSDTEYCPMVTPDGRCLFFSRRISEPKDGGWDKVVAGDVYWIRTEAIRALHP